VSLAHSGFYAGIDCEVVRDVYADSAGTQKLSDYTVFSGKVSYSFLEHYKVFVNLSNIGDKDYETYYQYPMPGFTILGGASVTL
jgi:outer membrane cobalamin receptor